MWHHFTAKSHQSPLKKRFNPDQEPNLQARHHTNSETLTNNVIHNFKPDETTSTMYVDRGSCMILTSNLWSYMGVT